MKTNNFLKLAAAILLCEAAGAIGTIFTAPAIPAWYAGLTKPDFSPPNWLFGPVWIALYALMGVTLYRLWMKKHNNTAAKYALILFFIQLAVNAKWSFLFFGLQNPFYGLLGIITLWIAIVLTIAFSWRVDRVAALLLVPYFFWVTFASVLNWAIWVLNG